jgi:hypothetical protein
VRTPIRPALIALFWLPALVVCGTTLGAAPQQPTDPPPVSLDRIKDRLERAPALQIKTDVPLQLPTFKSRVDQHVFVLTLEQALHRDFDLNIIQRQSADWASKCCGVDLGQIVKIIDKAVEDRKIRKTREQIERELAEIEAARRKAPLAGVK